MKLTTTTSLAPIIIIIIFVSSLSSSSPQTGNGAQTSNQDWTTMWKEWAQIAWRYFQSGVGVNPNTGLHYADQYWHGFTDWDVGTYILAILDAEKLNLITYNTTWGVYYRLDKIFTFLETRSIRSDGKPAFESIQDLAYYAADG